MLGDEDNDIISSSFHSCELPIDASVRPVPYYQYNCCQNSFSHFQNIFSECFMNNFSTKTLRLSTTTGYHISQVDYANQSNINLPLDMLMSKTQLMKINRNVEHSIAN